MKPCAEEVQGFVFYNAFGNFNYKKHHYAKAPCKSVI
jgi:hypothetical protein